MFVYLTISKRYLVKCAPSLRTLISAVTILETSWKPILGGKTTLCHSPVAVILVVKKKVTSLRSCWPHLCWNGTGTWFRARSPKCTKWSSLPLKPGSNRLAVGSLKRETSRCHHSGNDETGKILFGTLQWCQSQSQCQYSTVSQAIDNITEDTYEVESCKNSIELNLPIQVDFLITSMSNLVCYNFIMIFWTGI